MASITESAHWRARYGVSPYTSAAYKTVEDRRREDKAWLGDAGRRTYDEGTCGWMRAAQGSTERRRLYGRQFGSSPGYAFELEQRGMIVPRDALVQDLASSSVGQQPIPYGSRPSEQPTVEQDYPWSTPLSVQALATKEQALEEALRFEARTLRDNASSLSFLESRLNETRKELAWQKQLEEERFRTKLLAGGSAKSLMEIRRLEDVLGKVDESLTGSADAQSVWAERMGDTRRPMWSAPEPLPIGEIPEPRTVPPIEFAANPMAQRFDNEPRYAPVQYESAGPPVDSGGPSKPQPNGYTAGYTAGGYEPPDDAAVPEHMVRTRVAAEEAAVVRRGSITADLVDEDFQFANHKSWTLPYGKVLFESDKMTSQNGKWELELTKQGNVLIKNKHTGEAHWSTETHGLAPGPFLFHVRNDGNLVLKDTNEKDKLIWATGTNGIGRTPHTLKLMDNGTLHLHDHVGMPIWFSAVLGPEEEQ